MNKLYLSESSKCVQDVSECEKTTLHPPLHTHTDTDGHTHRDTHAHTHTHKYICISISYSVDNDSFITNAYWF